jgi:hypothetical protein
MPHHPIPTQLVNISSKHHTIPKPFSRCPTNQTVRILHTHDSAKSQALGPQKVASNRHYNTIPLNAIHPKRSKHTNPCCGEEARFQTETNTHFTLTHRRFAYTRLATQQTVIFNMFVSYTAADALPYAEEGSPNRVRTQSNPQQLKQPRNSGLSCATSGIVNTASTVYYHDPHKSARPTNHSNTAHARNTRKHNHTQNTLPTSHPSSHHPTLPAILPSHSIHHHTHNHAVTSPRQPNTATQTQHKHTRTSTHPTLTKG